MKFSEYSSEYVCVRMLNLPAWLEYAVYKDAAGYDGNRLCLVFIYVATTKSPSSVVPRLLGRLELMFRHPHSISHRRQVPFNDEVMPTSNQNNDGRIHISSKLLMTVTSFQYKETLKLQTEDRPAFEPSSNHPKVYI